MIKSYLKYLKSGKTNYGVILLCLFALALYLPMIVTNILTIVLILYIIIVQKGKEIRNVFRKRFVLFFLLIYSSILVGFFYDIEISGVFRDLEKKLSFVLLPIIIAVINPNREDIINILKVFFYSGFLATSLAFCLGFYEFFSSGDVNFLINHELSENIGFHATYLSMYLVFSLSYPIFFLKSTKHRKIISVVSLIVIAYVLLLSVRIVWLIMFACLAIVILRELKYKPKKMFFIMAAGVTIFGLIIFFVPPIRERVKEAINYNNEYTTDKVWGGRGIRMLIWQSACELIKEKPITGYGSSREVQKNLNMKYIQNNYGPILYMMENNNQPFNAHNQYLEDILKYGFFLGFFYFSFLLFTFFNFLKSENSVGVFLILIIAGVSLTETILELNKGIVFFSFFIPLVFFFKNFINLNSKEI